MQCGAGTLYGRRPLLGAEALLQRALHTAPAAPAQPEDEQGDLVWAALYTNHSKGRLRAAQPAQGEEGEMGGSRNRKGWRACLGIESENTA